MLLSIASSTGTAGAGTSLNTVPRWSLPRVKEVTENRPYPMIARKSAEINDTLRYFSHTLSSRIGTTPIFGPGETQLGVRHSTQLAQHSTLPVILKVRARLGDNNPCSWWGYIEGTEGVVNRLKSRWMQCPGADPPAPSATPPALLPALALALALALSLSPSLALPSPPYPAPFDSLGSFPPIQPALLRSMPTERLAAHPRVSCSDSFKLAGKRTADELSDSEEESFAPDPAGRAARKKPRPCEQRAAEDAEDCYKTFHAGDFDNRMHPRNIYFRKQPDFAKLAQKYPSFSKHMIQQKDGKSLLNWKDAQAHIELTKTLLQEDFQISWDIPPHFLCPPLPQRLNYIHWIEDLLAGTIEVETKPADSLAIPPHVRGVDIGVGANCIYPLLGVRTQPGWKFLGSDINGTALECARANVQRNGLEGSIDLRLMDRQKRLLVDLLKEEDGEFDFVMCNPPFFASMDEAKNASHVRSCSGNFDEMVTDGGEVAFVSRIIEDSKKLQTRVRWYTSMLGHRSSVRRIMGEAKGAGAKQVRTTKFFQGKTVRWAVGWSFHAQDARQTTCHFVRAESRDEVVKEIESFVQQTGGIQLEWDSSLCGEWLQGKNMTKLWKAIAHGKVLHETWTRRARRQQKMQSSGDADRGQTGQEGQELFSFVLVLQAMGSEDAELREWQANIWLLPSQHSLSAADTHRLFDSFSTVLFKVIHLYLINVSVDLTCVQILNV
eukprot:768543-Hanusia_phi.AAC.3